MFIAVAVFQCFTYIIFNVDFEIILNGDARVLHCSLENLYQTGTTSIMVLLVKNAWIYASFTPHSGYCLANKLRSF